MAGLFIALFVDKCTACQSHWKSDFGWHRFQKWAYSLALAWGVRGLESLKQSWDTWWPSEAASRLVSLSNYCLWCVVVVCFFGFLKWSVWFMWLSLYTSNDLTYNSIKFKKAFRHFLTANSKRRFWRKFSYDVGCKQKALRRFSCLEFILKKSKHREAGLKHK